MKTNATAKRIQSIINNYGNNDGRTYFFNGKGRYVVAITHNENPEMLLLQNQLTQASNTFDYLTIGGRTDQETEVTYIDIGTSTDDYLEAMNIASKYNQIAIRDNQELKEIRL